MAERDDFGGNAPMSYYDLLRASPYQFYTPPAYQRLAGDVLPMPGAQGPGAGTMSDFLEAQRQIRAGSNVVPFTPYTPENWRNIAKQHNILRIGPQSSNQAPAPTATSGRA